MAGVGPEAGTSAPVRLPEDRRAWTWARSRRGFGARGGRADRAGVEAPLSRRGSGDSGPGRRERRRRRRAQGRVGSGRGSCWGRGACWDRGAQGVAERGRGKAEAPPPRGRRGAEGERKERKGRRDPWGSAAGAGGWRCGPPPPQRNKPAARAPWWRVPQWRGWGAGRRRRTSSGPGPPPPTEKPPRAGTLTT